MNEFKKKMKEKIKIFSNEKYLNGYIKDEYITEDGDADIVLNLNSYDDLIDPRTTGHQLDLNKEVYEYIEEKSDMLENDIPLELHICGIDLDSKIQETIKHIFKEHYAIELYKIQRNYIKYRNKIISLAVLGLIAFIIYLAIFFYNDANFLLEVFGFIFTFSLWEAFDAYIYTFKDIRYERENITQNLLMKISFDEKTEKSSTEII